MNYNPSPREAFISDSKQVAEHHVLVESDILRLSIDTALAEYSRRCAKSNAPELGTAAGYFLKIQGAHELVEVLYNLAETDVVSKSTDNLNLPSNVKPLRK